MDNVYNILTRDTSFKSYFSLMLHPYKCENISKQTMITHIQIKLNPQIQPHCKHIFIHGFASEGYATEIADKGRDDLFLAIK